jgi:thiamine-phosphate diphosphorylase
MFAAPLSTPVIMAVSDRTRLGAADDESACERVLQWARAVASAGVDLIQIRERGLADRQLEMLTREIAGVARSTSARVVVNDRVDVALATGIAGVHLPSSAPACARVREIVPAEFLIGRSIHLADLTCLRERREACDYLLFGTVFPSQSKRHGHAVAGVASLAAVCEAASAPVLAIGGVDAARAEEAARAGAAGIAAIGLFADPVREHNDRAEPALREIVGSVRQAFERGQKLRWTQVTDHR